MTPERQAKVMKRLADIPKAYQASYREATKGNSLREAVNSHCRECCGWQREDVRLCTDLACSLYAVRPYQGFSQEGRHGPDSSPESSNDGGRVP